MLEELNRLKQLYRETFILNQQRDVPVIRENLIDLGRAVNPNNGNPPQVRQITKMQDLQTDEEIEFFLKSMTPEQVLNAARFAATRSIQEREDTVERVMTFLTRPDMDIDTAITTQNAAQIEQLRMLSLNDNIIYYAIVRERARQLYKDTLSRLISAEDKKYGSISSITPSRWIADFIEGTMSTTARGTLYEAYRVKVPNVDQTTEMRLVRTYSPDLHHLLSKFASVMSIVPFIPSDSVRSNMAETVFADIQLLIHFAIASNSDTLNYFNFLKNEFDFLSDGTTFSRVKTAVRDTVIKLLRVRDRHVFALKAKKSIAPVDINNPTKTEIPHEIMKDLLPFIIDNKSTYDLKTFQERMNSQNARGKLVTLEKDTPIGRFLNFDRNSAAEFERVVKNIKRQHYIVSDARVSVKSQGPTANMDCVRHIYSAMMVAAGTLYYVFQTDFTKALERLIVRNVDTKRVQYVPTLEAYPGALFFSFLHDSTMEDRGIERFTNNTYMNDYRNVFAKLLENFVRTVPTLRDVNAQNYVPCLRGPYTDIQKKELAFSTNTFSEKMQGMRFMDIDTMKMFRIREKVGVLETMANYLTITLKKSLPAPADEEAATRSMGYFFGLSQRDRDEGEVLTDEHIYKLPHAYLGPTGPEMYSQLPVIYRFKTETIIVKKERQPQYTSALESENAADITSLLTAVTAGTPLVNLGGGATGGVAPPQQQQFVTVTQMASALNQVGAGAVGGAPATQQQQPSTSQSTPP